MWRRLAIFLLIVVGLELLFIWKHWDEIYSAWKNRKLIGEAADGAAAVSSVAKLVKDVRSGIF